MGRDKTRQSDNSHPVKQVGQISLKKWSSVN